MAIDQQRHDAIWKRMERLERSGEPKLEAVACFTPSGILLLTGYWPVMGASVALFSRGGRVAVIVPEDERELAESTSQAEVIAYKPHSLDQISGPAEALGEPVQTLLKELHLAPGPMGTELRDGAQAAPYLSGNHFRESILPLLTRGHAQGQIVAADAMLESLKAVKTDIELDLLRRAAQRAGAGFAEAETAIAPGRTEEEVAADIQRAFDRTANRGFERGLGHFFCMSGPVNSFKASGAFARTRTRRLESGDLVMIHANTAGDGYWTDITRTYIAGKPSGEQQRMQDAIAEARDAGLKAIAPGVNAAEVDAAVRDVLSRHGFGKAFKHATGHGVGFAAADPNALPRIHPRSPDRLEAGMTFNIEPAIYIEGVGGMRHCDVVACTVDDCEVLTKF